MPCWNNLNWILSHKISSYIIAQKLVPLEMEADLIIADVSPVKAMHHHEHTEANGPGGGGGSYQQNTSQKHMTPLLVETKRIKYMK